MNIEFKIPIIDQNFFTFPWTMDARCMLFEFQLWQLDFVQTFEFIYDVSPGIEPRTATWRG